MTQPVSAVITGSESLLIACATKFRELGHQILAVVSDEPRVVAWADQNQVPRLGPKEDLLAALPREFDYFLSIANLRMVPPELLARARRAAINFHDGPLPRYAGLNAPVWALLEGESEHGVTWHLMQGGPDEGEILVQRRFSIDPAETAFTLNAKCYEHGLETFSELAQGFGEGRFQAGAQDLRQRTYFGRHKKPEALGLIRFNVPASSIDRLVRALNFGGYHNPVALAKLSGGGRVLYPTQATVFEQEAPAAPGTLLSIDESGLRFATAQGSIRLERWIRECGSELSPGEVPGLLGLTVGSSAETDPDSRSRLEKLALELSPRETYWEGRLKSLQAIDAPLARSASASPQGEQRLKLEMPGADHRQVITAFLLWLARLSGHWTLSVGVVDSERDLIGWDSVFARVVPLTLTLKGEQGFSAATAEVCQAIEKLRGSGSYARDLVARNPGLALPQYAVGVELGPWDRALLRGRKLCLAADQRDLALVYDRAFYDPDQIASIAEQLKRIVLGGGADPEMQVAKLSIVPEEEREFLDRINQTDLRIQGSQLIHRLIEEQVQKTPQALAVVFEGRALSYTDLNLRANQLAHRLSELGAGPDQLIGLCLPRTDDLLVAALAILKAGAAYVPLDPAYPEQRIALMIEDSAVPLIVTRSDFAARLPKGPRLLCLDTEADLSQRPGTNPEVAVEPAHLAYVIYTSGSTGRPKGVMVEHRNVVNFFWGMDQRIDRGPDPCWLAVTSLSFDISVLELFWTLARGFKVVLAGDSETRLSHSGSAWGLNLEFSLFYFASDEEGPSGSAKYRLLLEGARFADEHGFSAIWTPERHFGAFGGLYPNPSVASAALAVITKRVALRSGSCVLPLHHPIRVAEEWALVDNLSNGRVGISFASGWHPNDFVLRAENFPDNKQAMFRDIEIVQRLWRGETLRFEGPKGPVEVKTRPRPVQPELPIWITAAGNQETFEAAGKIGASLLTHLLGQSLEEVRDKVAAYRRARQDAGHPGEGHVTLMLHTFVGDDDAKVKEIVRQPMKDYLKSSLSLIAQHAWSFPAFRRVAKEEASLADNFASLSEQDMDALLEYSFERYYETAGLFGSIERCQETLRVVSDAGVNEVACLIDFGVNTDLVLDQLPKLDGLRRSVAQKEPASDDYSLPAEIARHQVSHLQCTPSMARMLLGNSELRSALKNLSCFMLGGEALPPSLVQEIRAATGARLLNMYGPTETTIWSSTDPVVGPEVTLGRPIANTQFYVLDRDGEPLPLGVPGELCIGGLGVTRGYLKRAELTAERFPIGNSVMTSGARLYKTGDQARVRRDGRVEFLGRLDHQVKVRGYRIELGEIEAAFGQLAGIAESVVVAREDVPGEPRLVAYYTAKAGASPDTAQMRRQLAEALPEYMVPSHLIRMDRFPLTANAKIDRKALPVPESAQRPPQEFIVPTDDVENAIASVWQKVLGIDRVGATDNFFEIGGHSLLAVRAHRELREGLGMKLSITDIFRFPTARGLREYLLGSTSAPTGVAEHLTRAGARLDAAARRAEIRRARRGSGSP